MITVEMNKRKLSDISNDVDSESNTSKIKKITAENGFINYLTVPSLESIALTNIIARLWNDTDFGEKKLKYGFKSVGRTFIDMNEFNELSKIISEKLSHFSLPKPLKCKAENIIQSIGFEIVQWIRYFEAFFERSCVMEHFRSVRWTMRGTIDKVKTLELHLDDKNVQRSFGKAAELCLENHIPDLWKQIRLETQGSYFYMIDMTDGYRHHLQSYWVLFLRNELPTLLSKLKDSDVENIYNCNYSICMNMLTVSVFEGKMLAVKYFWNKLTDEERNNKVNWTCLAIERRKCIPEENEYADIIFFLLSQLDDKEQQREVFQTYSDVILSSLFFCWPWQKFLLPTLELMWDFLDTGVYIKLLLDAINCINENNFIGVVFIDLWCNSPRNFKTDFIQTIIERNGSDIFHLFEIGDTKTVKLIFKDATVEGKRQIIFSITRSEKLWDLMYMGKLYLLEILMMGSEMSECEINDVKEDILLKYGEKLCYYYIYYDNWQIAKNNLDWCFYSEDQASTFKANILNNIKENNGLGILGSSKWTAFEVFITWLFNSDEEEIDQFKSDRLIYHKMKYFIYDIILRVHNFEFADKLLIWFFPSTTEIDQFKKELMFSGLGIDMFHKVYNHLYIQYDYGYWNLIGSKVEEPNKNNLFGFLKELTEWFGPFEKESIIEFKAKFIEHSLGCLQFTNKYKKCELKKIHKFFFPLLDNLIPGSDGDI